MTRRAEYIPSTFRGVDDNSGDDNSGNDSTIQATQACVTGALEEVIKAGGGTSGDNGYGGLAQVWALKKD